MALEYQVKYTTFRRLWFRYAQEALNNRPVQYPRQIGIDEFSVTKRHKYQTVLVMRNNILNYLWLIFGRAISVQFVRSVHSLVIVADKFHIIRMVNYALDFTRRVIQRQAKKGRKKIIFRAKHLLLKAHERLTPEEHERLMELFKVSPILGEAYGLKELLRQIYALNNYEDACGLLRCWCRMAYDSNLAGFRKVAKAYLRWFDIITNYFKYRVTNGFAADE